MSGYRIRGRWFIGQDEAVHRILASVERERRIHGEPEPTPGQVAMVLHALADYTALQQALRWGSAEDPAQSVGRWLHDLADEIGRTAP